MLFRRFHLEYSFYEVFKDVELVDPADGDVQMVELDGEEV